MKLECNKDKNLLLLQVEKSERKFFRFIRSFCNIVHDKGNFIRCYNSIHTSYALINFLYSC